MAHKYESRVSANEVLQSGVEWSRYMYIYIYIYIYMYIIYIIYIIYIYYIYIYQMYIYIHKGKMGTLFWVGLEKLFMTF